MQNITHPIQSFEIFESVTIEPNKDIKRSLRLSTNEFMDYDNYFGFLTSEPEPFNFLSLDNVEKEISPSDSPKFSITFSLSDK